jgi:hypothetical protein
VPSQWGRDKTCPSCGISYKKHRTGLRFMDVKQWFWINSEDSSCWRYKRRSTILGAWHAAKIQSWELHLQECALQSEYDDAREPAKPCFDLVEGCPF